MRFRGMSKHLRGELPEPSIRFFDREMEGWPLDKPRSSSNFSPREESWGAGGL